MTLNEWIVLIAVLSLFILFLVLVGKDVMDRAALVIIFGLASFAIIHIFAGAPLTMLADFLVGTKEDGYINLHSVLLIFGTSIISFYCQKSGLFQFTAFKVIQATKGDANKVMIWNTMLGFFVSAILADQIAVIILIPLTISICRTLKLKPYNYIITQAIFIKIGATVMPISSVPTIMITSHQGIGFLEYMAFAGLISTCTAIATTFVYSAINKRRTTYQKMDGIHMFLEYNPWTFVQDKPFMIKIASIFGATLVAFIAIPPEIMRIDTIALLGAVACFFAARNKELETFKEIEFDLLVYILGIFVISGCVEYVGVIKLLGVFLKELHITEPLYGFLILIWVGAIASAFVDNIPIMQLFLPLINVMLGPKGSPNARLGTMGLSMGIIWGDNFSPFGDTIMVFTIAQKYGVRINPGSYAKIGAATTFFQMSAVSLVIITMFNPIFLIVDAALILIGIFIVKRMEKKTPTKNDENTEGTPDEDIDEDID